MQPVVAMFSQYSSVSLIGLLLLLITLGFLLRFVVPALRLGRQLRTALVALGGIKARAGGNVVELDEVAERAMRAPALAHPWSEYCETLHPQREPDVVGQGRIARWRATALAEAFFSEQVLVDTPLKTEFYKHLPGILTGLGIIGTFSGLISGLSSFDVSNAAEAQVELKNLINAVGHAFVVSAAAIALAMLFTWIEKSLITARYRQVEQLCQLIDSLFAAGAGEEYLARLVAASETQATQAAHIKDALVVDLREILTTLAERQMEAQARSAGEISVAVGKVITDRLGGPIEQIGEAVGRVTQNQGEAVNKMLTDVLAAFSAQMQEMFGGQMRGINDLLRETSDAMRATAETFATLAANMDSAGKSAADAMGHRLSQAITAMEARQQIMNKQMGEFVSQIRGVVTESQTESSKKLQETLGAVGAQVASVVTVLRRQTEASAEAHDRRQELFEATTGKAVNSLSSQIATLLTQSAETNRSLQETVAKLSQTTESAIAGMNAGAETLYIASSDFAKAGHGVAETMRAASDAVGTIKGASDQLVVATTAVRSVLGDYERTRASFATMVSELKAITESAKREAAMTSEFVAKIKAATEQLAHAQLESEEYLKGINNVLVEVHKAFSENVKRTLQEGNRQFQKELRDAVNMVSAAVKDLGDTLDDLPKGR